MILKKCVNGTEQVNMYESAISIAPAAQAIPSAQSEFSQNNESKITHATFDIYK